MYDIKNDYLYEVFDDYKVAASEEEKELIFSDFCDALWRVPNSKQVYVRYISYKITKTLPDDIFEIFNKYKLTPYNTYKSLTKNLNSWHLLRQKINNLYNRMCNDKVCSRKDYFDALSTAKRLYYRYINSDTKMSACDIQKEIEKGLKSSDDIFNLYGKQKIKLSWNEYKVVINGYLYKCLENYIPLEDFEEKNKLVVDIDFWIEDNYVVKYVGKCLSGYMKKYEKKYYGVPCNKEYERCCCGGLFIQNETNRIRTCNKCNKKYKPIKTKIIKCIDCGLEFEVNGYSKQQKRCKSCYKKFRRRYKTDKDLKRYHNKIN